MTTKKKLLHLALSLILVVSLFAGCGSNDHANLPDCPFSDLAWDSSVSAMEELEGSDYTTEVSYYGGTAYIYSRTYKNAPGTIRYSFDEKDALAAIAWSYISDNDGEVATLYHSIREDMVKAYGDSGYQPDQDTYFGDVWYRKDGNIIVSAVRTQDLKAVQVTFVSPKHSADESDT